ncbi:hypothetical protein NQ318_018727 [Aromia moschata]|uniref:Uncharacterized protein n=1 Tax=Aromia moschata TaxID=1265417 RepID=A0AAV8ZFY7_9CUCU|nr:hypothetical protein NQ318_018727 [Aromia moschata]
MVCKLKAGQEYVFKSGIEVLQIYPRGASSNLKVLEFLNSLLIRGATEDYTFHTERLSAYKTDFSRWQQQKYRTNVNPNHPLLAVDATASSYNWHGNLPINHSENCIAAASRLATFLGLSLD